MHAIYAFGVLILLAFLGSRLLYRRSRPLSPFNFLFLTGLVYIFLGLFLGRQGTNILSSEVLRGFAPLISLGLGWIGFLFGFQLERRYLRRFPVKFLWLSWFQFLFNLLFTILLLTFALGRILPETPSPLRYGMAIAFGLLVSLNSPTLLNAVASRLPCRGDYYYLARFLSSVGAFWGITGLMLLQSFWRFPPSAGPAWLRGAGWTAASTMLPMLLGYLFHRLTKGRVAEQDLLVYLLGLVFFASGAAVFFNQAPLYVGMVLGITYSNLTRIQERIYPLLLSSEKPLFVVLLVLIGALWEFRLDPAALALVGLVLFSGAAGNILPLPLLGRALRFPVRLPHRFGLCFLSAGGIGVAFAVSLKLAYPMPETDLFLGISLTVIILSELISPGVIRLVLDPLDEET